MMKMNIVQIDENGESLVYSYEMVNGELISKTISESENFGDAKTAYCIIDGVHVRGDLFRYFEGDVGVDVLYTVMTDPNLGQDFLKSFREHFALATASDQSSRDLFDKAVTAWAKRDEVAVIDRLHALTEMLPEIPSMPAVHSREDLIRWVTTPRVHHFLSRVQEALPDLLAAADELHQHAPDSAVLERLTGTENAVGCGPKP